MTLQNIEQYGPHFQTKVLSSLLTHKKFLVNIYDVLNDDDFGNQAHKWIVKEIIRYYDKYHTTPSLDVLKVDRLKTGIMSATEIRNSIYNGFDSWKDHTPTCLINMIEEKYPKDLINPMNLSKEEWVKRNV